MTKAAIIISAILVFAGVAAAGTLTSGSSSDTPSIETPTLPTTTNDDVQGDDNDVRQEDRRANEPGEDLRPGSGGGWPGVRDLPAGEAGPERPERLPPERGAVVPDGGRLPGLLDERDGHDGRPNRTLSESGL